MTFPIKHQNIKTILFHTLVILTAITAGWLASQYRSSTLLTLVGAGMIFTGAFINKEFALYLLIFSMLLSPEFIVGQTSEKVIGRGVTLRLDDFLLVIIGMSWFAKNAVHKDLGLIKKTPLNKPIAYYILICILATAMGVMANRAGAKTAFFFTLKYIEFFIVFFMMINHAENMKQIKGFVFAMLLTCFVTSVIGIAQIPGGGRVSAPFEGEIGEPNTFGGYLVLVGALAGGLLSTEKRPKMKLLLLGLILAIVPAFLYTQSRTSYLAAIPAVFMLAFLSGKKAPLAAVILIGLLLSPFLLPEKVTDRIRYTFSQPEASGQIDVAGVKIDTSTSARLRTWRKSVEDWSKNPVFGYGITGYRFLDAQYPRVLTETGILGLAAFFWLIYCIAKLTAGNLKQAKTPFTVGLSRGFAAGFAGLLFHAIGANTFIIVRIMEPFWFLAGIMAVLPELEASEAEKSLSVR